MTDSSKNLAWDDLSCDEREAWINRYLASRGGGGYQRPLSDTEIDEHAREMYEDSVSVG